MSRMMRRNSSSVVQLVTPASLTTFSSSIAKPTLGGSLLGIQIKNVLNERDFQFMDALASHPWARGVMAAQRSVKAAGAGSNPAGSMPLRSIERAVYMGGHLAERRPPTKVT